MDDRLKQYLQECKHKALTWEQVEHVLSGSNYPAETIAEAKIWYENPNGITESSSEVKSVNPIKTRRKFSVFSLLIGMVVLALLVMGGGYGTLYLVASDKISLPNQSLQSQMQKIGLSVPGIPKNPKLILAMVEEAHEKVTKASYDLSISGLADSASFESLLGSKNIDLQIKGYSDISDDLNPRFSVNLLLGNQLEVDLRKPDTMMYIKVNKLPVAFYAVLGMDPVKIGPLWDNWIGTDVGRPDTGASQALEEALKNQNRQPQASEATQDLLKKVMMEEVLPSVLVSEEERNGAKTYKLAYTAKPEQIDKIIREFDKGNSYRETNPSEILKNLNLEVWIDKSQMLVVEMKIVGRVEMDKNTMGSSAAFTPVLAMTSEKQAADFAMVIKLGDFGRDVEIVTPEKYLSPEEFLSEFMKLEPGGLLTAINPTKQLAQARNAKRRSDINTLSTAIAAHNIANNNALTKIVPMLPTKISKDGFDLCGYIVPTEMMQIPADPQKKEQITSCKEPYDSGYEINKDNSGKITITAPLAENGETITVTR